jgi:copper(I)-binding protein
MMYLAREKGVGVVKSSVRIVSVVAVVGLLVTVALVGCGGPSAPKVKVEDVWARPAVAVGMTHEEQGSQEESGEGMEREVDTRPGMGATGAVFMKLVNEGREADMLVSAETDVATTVELHKTTVSDGVMTMEPVKSIEIPGKGEVLLKPGDYHIMLLGLNRDLNVGDEFKVKLNFEKSDSMDLDVLVQEM